MIAGVDSYLTVAAIAHYLAERRLLAPDNPNGFIPGEAAAAVLCARPAAAPSASSASASPASRPYIYNGRDGDLPLRGDGMTRRLPRRARRGRLDLAHVEYRISDLIGEQYFFKQTALASAPPRARADEFQDLWSPGESLGNVGAAVVPLMIGMALTAAVKGYAPGSPVLIEASGDGGACGAAVLHAPRARARGRLMSGVFANGLEISGKAVNAKTIAALPDVCFTPPENPATPPGVPVPYPSFGMASRHREGHRHRLHRRQDRQHQEQVDLSKTSGTEAGCAAKKGLITSKNTGKEYFNSWSNDVKFDGEPVIRFSDLATHNHASPTAIHRTWPHIANESDESWNAPAILNELGMQCTSTWQASLLRHGRRRSQNKSEHCCENQMLQNKRGGRPRISTPGLGLYSAGAPCVCMKGPAQGDQRQPDTAKDARQGRPAARNASHPRCANSGNKNPREAPDSG